MDVAAPEAPAATPPSSSRVWRIVAIVVASQLLIIVVGLTFFSMMGLASDGIGSCGGG